MRPDPETIRSLVAFLEQEDLEELSYEADGTRIRVRKESVPVQFVPAERIVPHPRRDILPPRPKAPAPPPIPPAPPKDENRRDLLSPMAGIFYRAPMPGAEPFVKKGDDIEVGQTIGLVEAMKTFNEVSAEEPGRVLEFYLEDGGPVQAGQPVLAFQPAEVQD